MSICLVFRHKMGTSEIDTLGRVILEKGQMPFVRTKTLGFGIYGIERVMAVPADRQGYAYTIVPVAEM